MIYLILCSADYSSIISTNTPGVHSTRDQCHVMQPKPVPSRENAEDIYKSEVKQMDRVLLTMMHEQNWYAGKWITAKTQKEKDYYMGR